MKYGELAPRLAWAAAPFAVFLAAYFGAAALAPPAARDPSSPLDRFLPCEPSIVWIYLGGFVLPFLPAFLLPRIALLRAALSFGILIAVAATLFVLAPTDGHALRAACAPPEWPLSTIQRLDPATNLFPSLHVGFAVLAALQLARWRSRWRIPAAIVAALQPVAVCLVKQHAIVDVVAGALLAFAVYRLTLARSGAIHP